MSGIIWTKFFWSDWQADPALRLCSYSARGLWMDMLCIAAAHDPIGYVAVAGQPLEETAIARMTGGTESEVAALLGELERNGVFSRDRKRMIYSRRMVADAKKSAIAKKNGKNGGNPKLCNHTGFQPSDKGGLKPPDKPHKPRTNIQKDTSLRSVGADALPDWVPRAEWDAFVRSRIRLKAPLTDHAITLAFKELATLRDQGHAPADVLNNSILNGWKGIYAPRPQSSGGSNGKRTGSARTATDQHLAGIAEAIQSVRGG